MQILKERKSLFVKILVSVLFVFLCYGLSVKTFHWTVCEEKEPHGLEFDLFLMFCEKEKDEWFEKRFWEECTKNDKNLPPHTELLISACKEPAVRGFSDGEELFVIEDKTGESYFLDLRTGEKTPVPDGKQLWDEVFLSPYLVWFNGYLKPSDTGYIAHYVLDLTDGKKYELFDLSWMPLKDGKFDTQNYGYIKSAEHVYFSPKENAVIALAPNFRQNPNQNVIYFDSSLEKLLNDLGVNYELVDYSLADADVPSPTGKYVVRNDGNGIYFSGTNLPIITGAYSSSCFKSWSYDESAVVIACGISGYLYHNSITHSVSHPIPLPVLKLFLPTP